MPSQLIANAALNPYGPQITFRTENILPPAALYLGPQDGLAISMVAPLTQGSVTLSYRLLTPQGTIITSTDSFPFVPNAVAQSVQLPPAEGYLLSATIQSTAVARGQVFVRFFSVAGDINNGGQVNALLIQGYPAQNTRLSFPQSPIEADTSGNGFLGTLLLAPPPPGGDFSLTVFPATRFRVKSLHVTLTTNAVVGNRFANLQVTDSGGNVAGVAPIATAVTAGQSMGLTWFQDAAVIATPAQLTAPLFGDLLLSPGDVIESVTNGLVGGDQYGQAVLFVEEWASLN